MNSDEYIDFFANAMALKQIKRTGWVNKGIADAESAADHTYGVVVLAATVPLPSNVDRCHLIKMAISHDMGETVIGDIKWETGKVSDLKLRDAKLIKERAALNEAFEMCPDSDLKEYAVEYMEKQTPASKFLKQLDKLDMAFQALAYEQLPDVEGSKLDEFWENAELYITDKFLKKVFETIRSQRNE